MITVPSDEVLEILAPYLNTLRSCRYPECWYEPSGPFRTCTMSVPNFTRLARAFSNSHKGT